MNSIIQNCLSFKIKDLERLKIKSSNSLYFGKCNYRNRRSTNGNTGEIYIPLLQESYITFQKFLFHFQRKRELCREDKYNTYKTEGKKKSL